MCRRAFWECLGQEVGPVLREGLRDSLRVQHVTVRNGLEFVRVSGRDLVDKPAARFRTRSEVNEPLLPPNLGQRLRGAFAHASGEIRTAEGIKPILRSGPDVRITR